MAITIVLMDGSSVERALVKPQAYRNDDQHEGEDRPDLRPQVPERVALEHDAAHQDEKVHLLAQRLDLRRAARHLQVLEARLRIVQPLLGLDPRRALGLLLQREHRLAALDRVAAPDVELLQLAGIGRGEQHVLAFDVACQTPGTGLSQAASPQTIATRKARRIAADYALTW